MGADMSTETSRADDRLQLERARHRNEDRMRWVVVTVVVVGNLATIADAVARGPSIWYAAGCSWLALLAVLTRRLFDRPPTCGRCRDRV